MSTEKKALESNLEQCLKEQASADSLRDDRENAKKERDLDLERRNKAMNQVTTNTPILSSRHPRNIQLCMRPSRIN